MSTKGLEVGILVTIFAVAVLGGVVMAQDAPDDAGPPDNVTTGPPDNVTTGPPDNVTTGPPDNVTRGPSENVTVGPPDGVAGFLNTTPLGPDQVDPNSLAGKIRVGSLHAENTTVELLTDGPDSAEMELTVTGNATNVTFYLQQQALEASHDISNLTMQVDGEPAEFGATQAGGGNWIVFEIDEFSTRTVSFESAELDDGAPGAPDVPPGMSEDLWDAVTGDGDQLTFQNLIDAVQGFQDNGQIGDVPIEFQDLIDLVNAFRS